MRFSCVRLFQILCRQGACLFTKTRASHNMSANGVGGALRSLSYVV
jgi:hypothetical protein